jgi:hypothetical protein
MNTNPVWVFEQIPEFLAQIDEKTWEVRGWCRRDFKVGIFLYPTTDLHSQSDMGPYYEVLQIQTYGRIVSDISYGVSCILNITGLQADVLKSARWFFSYVE